MIVRPFREDDRDEVHTITMRAFSAAPGTPFDPQRPRPDDDRRLVAEDDDGRVVGHLGAWRLGHHLGGRAVPSAGISAVVVTPEARGRGVGRALVRAGLDAARDRGEPLASLFPLTRRVYRSQGFELAGTHPRAQLDTAALARLPDPGDERLELAPGTVDDLPAALALEQRLAADEPGSLVRPLPFARRSLLASGDHHLVVARRDGELVGYLGYHHTRTDDPKSLFLLQVDELVAVDAAATLALWRVLGASAPGARQTVAMLAPEDPLHLWLPEQADTAVPVSWRWMLRLVDLPAAFAGRGWPDHLAATIDLDVADPTWPDQVGGRWRLRVEAGDAEMVRRDGGRGEGAVDVGALAAWFTGYQSATRLRRFGRLRCDDEATVRTMDALTAGPTPWVRSFF